MMILWWIEVGLLAVLVPLAVWAGADALHSVILRVKGGQDRWLD